MYIRCQRLSLCKADNAILQDLRDKISFWRLKQMLKGKIFVFSATGNSKSIAKILGEKTGLQIIDIDSSLIGRREKYNVEGETLGFVFPVYAWREPIILKKFLACAEFCGKPAYTFAAATCGDSAGNTLLSFSSLLNEKGITLSNGSVFVMPNNYLPLGDVDSSEVTASKLSAAEEKAEKFAEEIISGKCTEFRSGGVYAALLTGIVNPAFLAMSKGAWKKFRVNDKCISCGVCASVCPQKNIHLVSGKPEWGSECISCMGCIHFCPTAAINYSGKTEKLGRYHHPEITPANLRSAKEENGDA